MKFKAEVNKVIGKTKHSIGNIIDGEPKEMAKLPDARWLEIEEGDGGFFLYHYNDSGICISDTWHLSIDAAMKQAEFEFQIKKTDWKMIE